MSVCLPSDQSQCLSRLRPISSLLKQSANACASFSSTIRPLPLASEQLPDDDDGYDRLFSRTQRKHIGKYLQEFTDLIHKKTKTGLVDALKLFDEMKRHDRKKLQPVVYTLLITGCAKNGYLDKAFELFKEELKHNLSPTKATITSLFNGCAECPYPDKALEKIEYLRTWAHENGKIFNFRQYSALIKAYGKLGRLDKAYEVANEMFDHHVSLNSRIFASLLVGCISNKEKGFGEAIKIFRRMVYHGIPRELDTYKLLLMATRKCHIGSSEDFEKLTQIWLNSARIVYDTKHRPKIIVGQPENQVSFDQDVTFEYTPEGSISVVTEFRPGFKKYLNPGNVRDIVPRDREDSGRSNPYPIQNSPNFLVPSIQSSAGKVIDIDYYSLHNPCNRLTLIGGIKGILSMMLIDKVKPDQAVFAQILDLVPKEKDSEDEVIKLAREHSALGAGLFNVIINRRCERKDLAAAKEALKMMQLYNCNVDIDTFRALAKGCRTFKVAQEYMRDLNNLGIRPNAGTLKNLAENSCEIRDYDYMKFALECFEKYEIPPTRRLLDMLVYVIEDESQKYLRMEKGNLKPLGRYANERRKESFVEFNKFFEDWCSRTELQSEYEPWDQFQFKREDWGYYKMRQFEKDMMKKMTERPDFKELIESGEKFSVKKLLHSEFVD